jgi:hypothetical protein
VPLSLVRTVLQVAGVEFIILGFMSWLAAAWVQSEEAPHERTLDFLVALADLSRALTHTPPYIALTILGVLLIALPQALEDLAEERRRREEAQRERDELRWRLEVTSEMATERPQERSHQPESRTLWWLVALLALLLVTTGFFLGYFAVLAYT